MCFLDSQIHQNKSLYNLNVIHLVQNLEKLRADNGDLNIIVFNDQNASILYSAMFNILFNNMLISESTEAFQSKSHHHL